MTEGEPRQTQPTINEIMQQEYPNWQSIPEDERGRLLVMWLNDILQSEQGEALRWFDYTHHSGLEALHEQLGLAQDEILEVPRGTPKDIHDTAEYWQGVHKEAEAFWNRRYDLNAPEDWS